METCRTERLARERRSLVRQRIQMASILIGKYAVENPNQITPEIADICFMSKELRDLILESDPAVTVDEFSFSEWLVKLPEICQEWRCTKDTFLVNLLTSSTPGFPSTADESDVSRLQLATTYFSCQGCHGLIPYPRILAHSCMMASGPLHDDLGVEELWTAIRRTPWNHTGDKIQLHELAFNAARQIVLVCGKDPAVVTVSQMDELDARVECQDGFAGRSAMTWRAAVRILLSAPAFITS
jgi:hypothetical protein